MAKQAAFIQSFNAGEWSELMRGRADLDKFRSSCRKMFNFMATPQGAAVARNGTAHVIDAMDDGSISALLPFQFSETEACILEFSRGKLRFITEEGAITTGVPNLYTIANYTGDDGVARAMIILCEGMVVNDADITEDKLGLKEGDRAVIKDLPSPFPSPLSFKVTKRYEYLEEGQFHTQIYHYETDAAWPDGADDSYHIYPDLNIKVGKEYIIDTPYTDDTKLNTIRSAQKNDIQYLFADGYPVYKLSRFATDNWTLDKVNFIDGPYLDINHTNTFFNSTTDFSLNLLSKEVNNDQLGTFIFDSTNLPSPAADGVAINGYQIYIPDSDNVTVNSTIYSALQRAPASWTLYGANTNAADTNWVPLDTQDSFVDYVNCATDWIPVFTKDKYKYFRIAVTKVNIEQGVSPTISNVIINSDDIEGEVEIVYNDNINMGDGLTSKDIERVFRARNSNGSWASGMITQVERKDHLRPPQTHIKCKYSGMPLVSSNVTSWRLGVFGDSTGYPICGTFYAERLWMSGCELYPDTVAASAVGSYENMQPTDARTEDITDSDAILITLETRSRVLWMTSDDRGVVLGTGSGEYTIQSGGYTNYTTSSNITAKSILARSPTQRGSSYVDVVRIDHQIIHVQRAGRQLRSLAYSFEIDGYNSTSLSTQATHLGQPQIIRLAYQAEPYSTVWCVRSDGKLLAFAYMLSEQVSGWSLHDVGGEVESIATIPSPDSQQDTLWMSVKRQVNGQSRRYIERLLRPWDFDMTEDDAAYIDSCVVAITEDNTLKGLDHLIGEDVRCLVNGKHPGGPFRVDDKGRVDISSMGLSGHKRAVVGLPMRAELITQRLEAGAQNGTAQGKTKRIDQIVMGIWSSGSGRVGNAPSLNSPVSEMTPIVFLQEHGVTDPDETLHTFDYNFVMPLGYDRNGSIRLTREEEDLFPFNIVAITAYVETQDAEG